MGIKGIIEKVIGTYSDRELKKIYPIVDKVLEQEPVMEKKSDTELKAMTEVFKKRLSNGETLDDILPEAFAVCREAAWRVLGMEALSLFRVVGGVVLHQGRIAEMKTGEGKTLGCDSAGLFERARRARAFTLLRVNDYLAKRDSEWMGKLYSFLGSKSLALVIHDMENARAQERRIIGRYYLRNKQRNGL